MASLKILGIWDWNEERFGPTHADRYTHRLRRWAESLPEDLSASRPVADDPLLRHAEFRKDRRSHGHVVILRITTDVVWIADIFHTAQDWRTSLENP